jgi:hypothetical protein
MTPKTLKRYNSKWPEVKIFSNLDIFLTKHTRIISCKGFHHKNVVLGDFSIKSKSIHLFVVVFLCIQTGWESYMTPRRPVGVSQGGVGALAGSSLFFLLVAWESYLVPGAQLHTFFYSYRD